MPFIFRREGACIYAGANVMKRERKTFACFDVCNLFIIDFRWNVGEIARHELFERFGVLALIRFVLLQCGDDWVTDCVSALGLFADSGRLGNPAGRPAPQLGVFTNDVSNAGAGKARVIVRHLADAPAVDVLAGGAPLINALANPGSAAAVVPAGTYPIEVVADANNAISAFGPADLTFNAGTTTVVYAVGSFFDGSFTPLLQTFPNS